MRKVLAVVLLALMISAALVCAGCGEKEEPKTPEKVIEETPPEETAPVEEFVQEQFSFRSCINFVRIEPSNNQLLTTPVETVTAYFSHDLGGGSFIEVTRNGISVVDGPMVIAPDLRSVSVKVKADRTGNYKVAFTPYYPSGYYETGKSGFSVVLD